ncbi:MAG: hypothetical protein ACYTAN_09785 [Planctomycetota bacterium]|jgi:hypothetical protein
MAERGKVLGQVALAGADTEEQLYKCPAGKWATVSTIIVCNRTAVDRAFRLSIDVGDDNAAEAVSNDFLCYDTTVQANEPYEFTTGLTVGPGDAINVRGSHADMTFQAFGLEVDL